MANKWKCPYCPDEPAMSKDDLIDHIDHNHRELIPEGWTASRLAFKIIRHKDHGTCVVCKGETEWNEKRGKYQRLCNNPQCRKALREEALKNHIKVYNCPTLLNDMEHQDKMLKGRHISGEYTFRDGGKISYVGSFEKKFLEFMDTVLECDSKDIMEPGPVLEYRYNGKTHKWITDFLYIPYNLIIEVKDGGDNPNKKTMEDTRGREKSKDKMITNLGTYNYLKLTNNNFRQLMSIFADLKQQMIDDTGENKTAIVHINEDFSIMSKLSNVLEPFVDMFLDIVFATFPDLKNHVKIRGKSKSMLSKEMLIAIRNTNRIYIGGIVSWFFGIYLNSIRLLCTFILQSLFIPAGLIGAGSKFIYDKIMNKKKESYILPFTNVPKGYKVLCINTHIFQHLFGSTYTSIADVIFGDLSLFDMPKKLISRLTNGFMWADQWDARDFILVDEKQGYKAMFKSLPDMLNPIHAFEDYDIDDTSIKHTADSYKTNIVAIDDGVVVSCFDSSINNERYARLGIAYQNPGGNYVVIMHEPMIYSVYCHMLTGSMTVSTGDIVKKGQILGNMGTTGNSSFPHLHFELLYNIDFALLAPYLRLTRSISNFDFQCINIPTVNILRFAWEEKDINKYLNKPYITKKKAWIPEACFIKPL